jgi:hypothetical protein
MTYDILIPSNAKTKELYDLTAGVIKNLREVEDVIKYNIVIIEQQKDKDYGDVTTLHYSFPFNYHKCLNYGVSKTENPHIVLCNNDLAFSKGWAENLHKGFLMGYRSLSPYCLRASPRWFPKGQHVVEGYNIGIHITGWCIAVERSVIKDIGGLSEAVDFWYSDNIYGEQIKRAQIRHAIVCCSYVTHTISATLNTNTTGDKHSLTGEQKKKYDEALRKL